MSDDLPRGATPLERLAGAGLELAEVMALVKQVEEEAPPPRSVRYGVSAGVTVDLLETFLRRQALLDGCRASVAIGAYGDHLGNARRFREAGVDTLILLDVFDNLLPALEARVPSLEPQALAKLREKVGAELRLVLQEASGIGRVVLCLYHPLAPPSALGLGDRVDAEVAALNDLVRQVAAGHPNVRLLQPGQLVARLGWDRAVAQRFWLRYRSPYTPAFWQALAGQVALTSRNHGQHYCKALALDADNTLWGGIVGEDGPERLKLGPHDYPGNVYWLVQQELLALQRQGVLLCLCSKNNPADLQAVLDGHPHMVLRDEHFAARQVNWDDKPTNLRRLAAALNLGLESFVFLDDSPFECEAVRTQLPAVRALQVPERIHEYPALLRQVQELFLGGGVSAESAAKTEQYRVRALAEEARSRFASQEEYLASLGLCVEVRRGEAGAVGRIAELTQKSNQFNLTTRRYTEGQILELMAAADAEVYALHVRDHFGDSGLTGVAILRYRGEEVAVEAFLLSCRVIGRGVELGVWPGLLRHAAGRGARLVSAEYLRTAKNDQVRDFYDGLGLPLVEAGADRRAYRGPIDALRWPPTPHLEVRHVF